MTQPKLAQTKLTVKVLDVLRQVQRQGVRPHLAFPFLFPFASRSWSALATRNEFASAPSRKVKHMHMDRMFCAFDACVYVGVGA